MLTAWISTAVWIIVVALVVNCITNLFSVIMGTVRWKQQYADWTEDRIHVRDKLDQLTEDMLEHIENYHTINIE